jgi:hypothetical protein
MLMGIIMGGLAKLHLCLLGTKMGQVCYIEDGQKNSQLIGRSADHKLAVFFIKGGRIIPLISSNFWSIFLIGLKQQQQKTIPKHLWQGNILS